jgi:hypothetical protein
MVAHIAVVVNSPQNPRSSPNSWPYSPRSTRPHLDRTDPTAADLLDPPTKPLTRTAPKDAYPNVLSRHLDQPTGARHDAQNTQTQRGWSRRFACD